MRDANALLAARTRDVAAARADAEQRQARLDTAAAALADFQTKLDTRHDQVPDCLTARHKLATLKAGDNTVAEPVLSTPGAAAVLRIPTSAEAHGIAVT